MSARAVTLLARAEAARDTMTFHFSKPPGFDFRAGQAIDLVLSAASGSDELRHAFSVVSAPHEPDLTITTRMRSSQYKRLLGSMPMGAEACIDGPFGSLPTPGNERPAVLVAGGIGITPFVSMLRDLRGKAPRHTITLLYSNRKPEDAAFLGELSDLARQVEGFRFVPTMTNAGDDVAWSGHRCRLDEALIREVVPEVLAPNYFLVGPPSMVDAIAGVLTRLGVAGDSIKSESFYGY